MPSYAAASSVWAILRYLSAVLAGLGRDQLSGQVEVSEAYIGVEEPGLHGGRARGNEGFVGSRRRGPEAAIDGRGRIAPLTEFASHTPTRGVSLGHSCPV